MTCITGPCGTPSRAWNGWWYTSSRILGASVSQSGRSMCLAHLRWLRTSSSLAPTYINVAVALIFEFSSPQFITPHTHNIFARYTRFTRSRGLKWIEISRCHRPNNMSLPMLLGRAMLCYLSETVIARLDWAVNWSWCNDNAAMNTIKLWRWCGPTVVAWWSIMCDFTGNVPNKVTYGMRNTRM